MKKNSIKRFIIMMAGLVILSLGLALFDFSVMGNNPYTAMTMAIGDLLHIDFTIILLIANSIFFIAEILWGRHHVGIGTIANWLLVGSITSFWIQMINHCRNLPASLPFRIVFMFLGVLILSMGASMYQSSQMGIAPYDVLSILLSERLPVPYFWCRIFTDTLCAVITFICGGLLGPGTLVCAFGLGPFISFFDRNLSQKLLQ